MGNQQGSVLALEGDSSSVEIVTQEKSESLAHFSHEAKTRLNAIIGFTEILKESINDPTLKHYLNIIHNSGDTLLSLVTNILDMPIGEPRFGTLAGQVYVKPGASSKLIVEDEPCATHVLSSEDEAGALQRAGQVVDIRSIERTSINTSLLNAQKEWENLAAKAKFDTMSNVVFAVDDNEDNLDIIAHLFAHDNLKMFPFTNGETVLEAVRIMTPSLILLDVLMPGMDGYEVCRRLKENPETANIPVIFLTSKSEPNAMIRGFQAGGVDYIGKPFGKEELLSRVRTHLKLHQTELSLKDALGEKDQLLNETLKGAVKVLIDILAMTNPDAFAQTLRVRAIAKRMASRLCLTNAWEVEIGILLSHLGCAVIPADIVMKKQSGGRLTMQENTLFNSHPNIAARFISNIPGLEHVADSIQNQFADFNPKGAPDLIKDFICIVFEYDNLIQAGSTQQQALDTMYHQSENYNPLVLGALEAEVRKLMDGFVVRTIQFEELKAGMIIADDIRNASNIILVRRNSELTDVLLEKLKSLRYCGRTYEPVKILDQIG
ncbi:MAG TPA: response regulator [Bacteroidota bacterium]|nr:response regulator [Bacteroidota bacterium]